MQLIVLGMHRSGTSVLARLLNLMGAYFGPEGASTGANKENPKGFWERRDVRQLNDFVLHSSGSDWNRVSGFSVEGVPGPIAAEFQAAAARLVLELDAHTPWLLKEPRMCLLFPLWRRVLGAPVCVHVLRHPGETAASLLRRNGIPMPAGLALWEKYVRAAMHGAAGLRNVVVSHRALMQAPLDETRRIYAALQSLGVSGLRLPSDIEILAFVDQNLYRERQDPSDSTDLDDTPQVKLFRTVMDAGEINPKIGLAIAEDSREALIQYEAGLPSLPEPAPLPRPQALETVLRAQLTDRARLIESLNSIIARLDNDFRQMQDQFAAQGEELARVRADLTQAHAVALEKDTQLTCLEKTAESTRLEHLATRSRLEANQRRLRELQFELASMTDQRIGLETDITALHSNISALSGVLTDSARINRLRETDSPGYFRGRLG